MRAHRQARRPAVDREDDSEARHGHTRAAANQPADVAAVIRLQRTAGNAAVTDLLTVSRDDDIDVPMPPDLAPFRSTAPVAPRDVAATPGSSRHYNARGRHGRAVDPEGASGVLPFTPPSGWNGELIAGRLSQLNLAVPQTDAIECVEVSVLVGLVLEGPGAVRASLNRYLATYRKMLDERGLTPDVRRQLTYGSAHLEDAIRSIDERSLTYADLAQLATAMFRVHVHADPRHSTDADEEAEIARAEGFTEVRLAIDWAGQDDVARLASALEVGEYLSCRIDAHDPGTGRTNHAVRIGRNARGLLYFYDPWPRRGAQYQVVDDSLDAIGDYFVTTLQGEPAARRWDVISRYVRTAPAASPSADGGGH